MKKLFYLPAIVQLSASLATLRSSFSTPLSNCVAVYPERSEGSHSCTPKSLFSKSYKCFLFLTFNFLLFTSSISAQQKTYCNPVNIDYGYTPIPNFSEWGRHRATADPVIVLYKNDYY